MMYDNNNMLPPNQSKMTRGVLNFASLSASYAKIIVFFATRKEKFRQILSFFALEITMGKHQKMDSSEIKGQS